MEILMQTHDFVVINKPIGMLSQPAPSGEPDALTLLSAQLGKTVYPLHRLDRGTGGVMVYGTSKRGASSLSAVISSGGMEKEYLAIVHGICPEVGEMCDLLLHRSAGNKSFVVDRMRTGVKEARLRYTRIAVTETPEPLSLVRIALETGRTHQIRVQFAHRAHPLFGDGKYGAHSPGMPALFCISLTFPSPDPKQSAHPLTFRALPPRSGIWECFSLPDDIAK